MFKNTTTQYCTFNIYVQHYCCLLWDYRQEKQQCMTTCRTHVSAPPLVYLINTNGCKAVIKFVWCDINTCWGGKFLGSRKGWTKGLSMVLKVHGSHCGWLQEGTVWTLVPMFAQTHLLNTSFILVSSGSISGSVGSFLSEQAFASQEP